MRGTTVVRDRTMLTAGAAFEELRPKVAEMVGVERARLGDKMPAYAAVGRAIGASGGWVRKFLGRQEVGLPGHVALNIDRLAAEAEADRQAEEAARHAFQQLRDFSARLAAVEQAVGLPGAEQGGALDRGRSGVGSGADRAVGEAAPVNETSGSG